MNLHPLAESARSDLRAAVATRANATQRTTDPLVAAVEPAIRLITLDPLTDATADVNASSPGVIVEVRTQAPSTQTEPGRAATGPTGRITGYGRT